MNVLDEAISYLFPGLAATRFKERLKIEHFKNAFKRKYDGAARGRRTKSWGQNGNSANAEIKSGLKILRDRSRELTRNNAYASRALQVIETNVVGTGIVPSFESEREIQPIEKLWADWGDTVDCDYDGNHDFYGIQSLAMRCVVESGEVLIRRRRRRAKKGRLPIQLQVLEPDFIDSSKEENRDNAFVIQGIEFSKTGKLRGYWLFEEHPGSQMLVNKNSLKSKFVSASEILHIFRVDRPGQVRGVPWGASSFIRLKDFEKYEDAELLKQQISSCFAGFVHDAPNVSTDDQTIEKDENGNYLQRFEPGQIEHLQPGQQITFANPPKIEGYTAYTRQVLRSVACGYGVTYESLTGDLSNVNYSSGRMGWLDFQRNIELWRWKMLIPQLCDPVFEWFADAAQLLGAETEDLTSKWTPPRREMIDPTKEIPAIRDAVRSGIKTLSEAIREQGGEPDVQLSELESDNKKIDERGLILDSDARVTTQSGIRQFNGDDE